jgi:hypothetical protein
MATPSYERLAAACVILGASLLAAYAVLFLLLLPVGNGTFDYPTLVVSPHWTELALVALIGVISLLAGLDAIYVRLQGRGGLSGTVGLLFTKVALVLQACMLTWELLLDPIIAGHPDSAFLLRDGVIATAPLMVVFRWVFLTTSVVGALLFGGAIYRSRQFRGGAILLIVAGAAAYVVGPRVSVLLAISGVIMFALGGVLVGVRLWRPPSAT